MEAFCAVGHRIYSQSSREVWLAVRKRVWSRIRPSIKLRLLDGLDRIVRVRDQIGAAAAVSTLPPVQVIPELWYGDGYTYDGCTGPVIIKGRAFFACILPAQTATLEDEGFLRRLMVHEFCHCLWHLTEVVKASDAGITKLSDPDYDQNSDVDDRSHLAAPEDWFGLMDVENMLYTNYACHCTIQNLVGLLGQLPVRTSPPRKYIVDIPIALVDEVITHVRNLTTRTPSGSAESQRQ